MAGLRSVSYTELLDTRHRLCRQSGRAAIATAIACLALSLGGCGIVVPLSSFMSGSTPEAQPVAPEVTGSIGRREAAAQPDTDADAVRRAIEVAAARGVDAPVAWKNDTTGNSGTVTASRATRAPNGAPCRDFETTVSTVGGVDLHGGRICQGFAGTWEVLRFERVGG